MVSLVLQRGTTSHVDLCQITSGILSAVYSQTTYQFTRRGGVPFPGPRLPPIAPAAPLRASVPPLTLCCPSQGLPNGPFGLLGAAEGVSYLAILAGLVVLGFQITDYGYIPNAIPVEGGKCA